MANTERFVKLEEKGKRIKLYDKKCNVVINAYKRTYEDFVDEFVNGGNECACCVGEFSIENKKYVYWYDSEIEEDYFSEIN